MKNILKVIGLSFSVVCLCSADKCWHCGKNNIEDKERGICQQCVEGITCSQCGIVSEVTVIETARGRLCGECRFATNDWCWACGAVSNEIEIDETSGDRLCPKCHKAKQDPFGM